MKNRKNKYPIIESLEITEIAAEGKSLGRVDEMVVFVPNTLPGDVVRIQVNNKRRRFMEGYVLDYITLSPMRVEPLCQHFGLCGGCKWQSLPYDKQLEFKQKQVFDQLSRLGGGLQLPEIETIVPSENTIFYRNKLEYTFSPKRWITQQEVDMGGEINSPLNALGFHIPGKFDKILDIEKCYLQADPSNKIRLTIKELTQNLDLDYYDIRTHEGYMRNVVIRTSTTGEVMVIVVFGYDEPESRTQLLDAIHKEIPEISSLNYIINTKLNDSIADQTVVNYRGSVYIEEQMEGLRFRINPKSFYQTNSEQAYNLYKVTREFASLKGDEVVYDLYTGAGTIANFIAKECKKVIGIEYVEEAIEDAKVNSKINSIDNTRFFAGDMKDILNKAFIEREGQPDVIILDPPRAGIHEDVAKTIIEALPKVIVYVSCNPATQARDLALFDEKYKIDRVRPVDMFPHTHHVENVVRLSLR